MNLRQLREEPKLHIKALDLLGNNYLKMYQSANAIESFKDIVQEMNNGQVEYNPKIHIEALLGIGRSYCIDCLTCA